MIIEICDICDECLNVCVDIWYMPRCKMHAKLINVCMLIKIVYLFIWQIN